MARPPGRRESRRGGSETGPRIEPRGREGREHLWGGDVMAPGTRFFRIEGLEAEAGGPQQTEIAVRIARVFELGLQHLAIDVLARRLPIREIECLQVLWLEACALLTAGPKLRIERVFLIGEVRSDMPIDVAVPDLVARIGQG